MPPDSTIHVPHKPLPPTEPPVEGVTAPSVPVSTPQSEVAPPPSSPQGEPLTFEEEIAKKEEALKKFIADRLRIEEDSRAIFSEKKTLEEKIAPILLEEKHSVDRIAILEKERLASKDLHSARAVEANRWTEEENRRSIEHRRWAVSEELELLLQKIHDSERAFKELSLEEEKSVRDIAALRIKIAQRELGLLLAQIQNEKGATLAELEKFTAEHARLEALLLDAAKSEEDALHAEDEVEKKSEGASSIYEEQVLAGERHKLEDARKEVEQKRWAAEDAIVPVSHSVLESQKHLDEITQREGEVLAKLDGLLPPSVGPIAPKQAGTP